MKYSELVLSLAMTAAGVLLLCHVTCALPMNVHSSSLTSVNQQPQAFQHSNLTTAKEEDDDDDGDDGPAKGDEFNELIVGGEPVKVGGRPYQVALFRSGSFVCGGSLIESDKVLTAAHCVYGQDTHPTRFFVRYGTLYRMSGQDLTVTRVIIHPQYSSATVDYDIAILLLEGDIEPGVNAATIPLAKQLPAPGSLATVSGWGKLTAGSPGGTLPLYLQEATGLEVLANDDCQRRWSYNPTITDRMLCTFSKLQSSCNGDSGGPMTNEEGELIGVVSWGSSMCLHPSHPNVYASVVNMREWIVNVTQSATSNRAQYCRLLSPLLMTSIIYKFFVDYYIFKDHY